MSNFLGAVQLRAFSIKLRLAPNRLRSERVAYANVHGARAGAGFDRCVHRVEAAVVILYTTVRCVQSGALREVIRIADSHHVGVLAAQVVFLTNVRGNHATTWPGTMSALARITLKSTISYVPTKPVRCCFRRYYSIALSSSKSSSSSVLGNVLHTRSTWHEYSCQAEIIWSV